MTWLTRPGNTQHWAKIGITVQFLALVRLLGEYFRLKFVHGAALSVAAIEPYITGASITALLSWLAVVLFFAQKYVGAVVVSVATVIALLIYKFVAGI
jgi:hypothetical protein